MKANTIVNLVLAISLMIVSVRSYMANRERKLSANNQDASNATIENIMTRASVRFYKNSPVEEGKIKTLLKAGMAAPSGMDKRPWHFVVVTDRKQVQGLVQANPRSASFMKNAPLVIVVCGDMRKADKGSGRDNWILDTAAATENILLAAHALDLGAVWTGVFPREERMRKVAEVLQLPDEIVPLSAILVGYPSKEVTPKDKWDENNVSYDVYGKS